MLAALLGAVGGGAGYVAVHAVDYLQFRAVVGETFEPEPKQNAVTPDELVDQAIVYLGGAPGFRGYLGLVAREGVSIKHAGSSDPGIALSGIGAWLVWLVEVLLAMWIAGFIAFWAAKVPFCERCKAWFTPEQVMLAGGSGSKQARKDLQSALAMGDVAGMARVLSAPSADNASFLITSRTCPQCAVDTHCTLKRVTSAKKTKVSVLESFLLTKDEATRLRQAMTPARPA